LFPETNPALLAHEPPQQIHPPPPQRQGDKILLRSLLVIAVVSVFILIFHWLSPDFFSGIAELLAPDRSLAPSTKAFIAKSVEASALLLVVLSLYALLLFSLPQQRRPKALGVFILAAAVLHWLYYYPFTIDDAYISLVYARNFASGDGLVFNTGERVEGYTNLLWVLIESALFGTGFDPIAGIKLIGLACGLGVLGLTYRIASRMIERTDFMSLAPLLLAISPPFATASALGLETQLFTLLIVAAACLYLESDESSPGYAVPLLLGLATLTRPEGAIFFVALYAHAFISQAARKQVSASIFISAFLFILIVTAHLVWRHAYYGAVLPNTYYAKMEGSLWRVAWGFRYLKEFLATYGGALFVVCLIPLVRREHIRKTSLLFLLIVPYVLYVGYTGGDWIPQFRFIEPVMPFVFILFAAGLSELYGAFEHRVENSLSAKVVLLALAGFLFFFPIADAVSVHEFAMTRAGGAQRSHIDLAKWLRENTSPDDSIALMDIGMVKYFSERNVIDISGLTDMHVARLPGGFLKKEFDIEYLFERNPKYVVLVSHNDITKNPRFYSSYEIDKSIYQNPLFREKYQFVFNVDHLYLRTYHGPRDGYWMNVFERKQEFTKEPKNG